MVNTESEFGHLKCFVSLDLPVPDEHYLGCYPTLAALGFVWCDRQVFAVNRKAEDGLNKKGNIQLVFFLDNVTDDEGMTSTNAKNATYLCS